MWVRRVSLLVLISAAALFGQGRRTLDIYWVDAEGGAATLIVTPGGKTLLVDTGNATPDDRDAKRILDAARQAGLKTIDYVLTTHFHSDHVGGAAALSRMIPIEHFVDHGDSIETQAPRDAELWQAYKSISTGKRIVVKPGDKIPLAGVDVTVVSANGAVLAKAVNGGGPNAFCRDAKNKEPDRGENGASTGVLLTYGKFKFLDLGDLTWDKEMDLACPVNKLGTVTVFQATHHGFFREASGAPAHVWALRPQVVVVNNGPRKGLQESAWDLMQKIPGLEAVWQGHLAVASDKQHNTSEEMIANLEGTSECKGRLLKASVTPDGTFTVTNSRNGFSKTYTAR
jgi:competence protein ComEC